MLLKNLLMFPAYYLSFSVLVSVKYLFSWPPVYGEKVLTFVVILHYHIYHFFVDSVTTCV